MPGRTEKPAGERPPRQVAAKSGWLRRAAAVLLLAWLPVVGGIEAAAAGQGAALPAAAPASKARWRPTAADTWQLQLQGEVNTAHDAAVYDIDLADTPQGTIDALHARGIRVVCYFSAGSSEDFRADFENFRPGDMGKALDGWPGERWLDVRSSNVRGIMQKRLDLATAKRCDGVDPDNVDGYANNSGFDLSAEDQLAYNRFLAAEAHRRNLAVGLKNDLEQVPGLVETFDFLVNEQCHELKECALAAPFPKAGKPVFNVEYVSRFRTDPAARASLCAAARRAGIRTLVLPPKLDDAFRFACDRP